MHLIRVVLLTCLILVGWCHTLSAERAPLSLEMLREEADLVLTGEIADLRVESERAQLEPGFGNYDWAIYLTIRIDTVEQGQHEAPQIVARCFRIKSRKSQVEYLTPSGNHPIPDVGTQVRAFIKTRGSTPQVIFPNGIRPLVEGDTLGDAIVVAQLDHGFTYLLSVEAWIAIAIAGGMLVATVAGARAARRWLGRSGDQPQ